jgi:hypothetical protein
MPSPCRDPAIEKSLSERHIRGMAGERHGVCESALRGLYSGASLLADWIDEYLVDGTIHLLERRQQILNYWLI